MMNVIALWILFSTLGAGNVMFPDQSLLKTPAAEQQHVEGATGAAKESLRTFLDTARQTGEGIRERVSSASHIPRKTADAVQHFRVDVAQALKDGSQSGLEKIGLARVEDRHRRDERSYDEIIKEDALNAYDRTKDAAGDTLEATGDKVRYAGSASKDKVTDAARSAKESVSDKVDSVVDSASGMSYSLQEKLKAAEGKASDIAGSAHEQVTDVLKGSAETADHTNSDPSISSGKEKIKHVSEQAADKVRSKATEAASLLPNLGQGLAYRTKNMDETIKTADLSDEVNTIAAESRAGFLGKVSEYINGIRHAAGGVYRCVKEQIVTKASNSLSEANETVRRTKDAGVHIARDNAGKIIDKTHRMEQNIADTRDHFTQTTADAADTVKNRTLEGLQKLKRIATAYLLSSCRTGHLFTFSSVYGSSLWVTLLSGYLLARSIPKQQFGFVQSRIFPAYLRLAGVGQAICTVLFLILHPWSNADRGVKLQQLNLVGILASTLANIFYFEPRATKAMFQKLKTEKEEGRGQDDFTGPEDDETRARLVKVDNKFKTFHGYSSMANLLSLSGMSWHLWHLSSRLVL